MSLSLCSCQACTHHFVSPSPASAAVTSLSSCAEHNVLPLLCVGLFAHCHRLLSLALLRTVCPKSSRQT
eukprot:6201896-Pleurochrysis_carterae.AAC.5